MRYWLYGVNVSSRSPREPLFIEAADEAAARAQAREMGMDVEEVEAVQPRVERTAVQRPSGRWPPVRSLHWLVSLALGATLLTLGILLAAGKVEIRPVKQEAAQAPSADPHIEWVEGPDKFFGLMGYDAFCFRYEGAWIDCWVEVEVDGKVTRLAESLGEQLRGNSEAARALAFKEPGGRPAWGEPSGHLVWARRPGEDKEPKEVWDLVIDGGCRDRESSRGFGGKLARQVTPARVSGFGSSRVRRESLSVGREIALVTLVTAGEREGQISRKLTLKCKAAK